MIPAEPRPSCVSPAPQLKREWSPWPEFWLDPRKSARPFKGIFCHDISEFESYMPSHAVGSLWGDGDPKGSGNACNSLAPSGNWAWRTLRRKLAGKTRGLTSTTVAHICVRSMRN